MRGPIWSDLGHLGLPDLVASTGMDASNSHADGRAEKPRKAFRFTLGSFNSEFEIRIRTVTQYRLVVTRASCSVII